MMTKQKLLFEAIRFRIAIENAKEAREFVSKRFKTERMNNFPYDCCDDTADLFTHYLYQEFNIDSIRVDGEYYDKCLKGTCYHSWQVTDKWLIDLTGDQFENDPTISLKADPVYVGKMDNFHMQFNIVRSYHSCGIECLGEGSHDRMYFLYETIKKYLK